MLSTVLVSTRLKEDEVMLLQKAGGHKLLVEVLWAHAKRPGGPGGPQVSAARRDVPVAPCPPNDSHKTHALTGKRRSQEALGTATVAEANYEAAFLARLEPLRGLQLSGRSGRGLGRGFLSGFNQENSVGSTGISVCEPSDMMR